VTIEVDGAATLARDGGSTMSQHRYEIRVRGPLTPTLRSEFAQLELTSSTAPIDTMLEGSLDDAAALHGVLRRIESYGLELVEVRRLTGDGDAPASARRAARGHNSSS
jgi:hypothetical protein